MIATLLASCTDRALAGIALAGRLVGRDALVALDPLWDELFPAEQARIVQLLVERVDLTSNAAAIRIRTAGIEGLVSSLRLNP